MNGGVLALNGNRNFEIRDSRNTTEELTVTTSINEGTLILDHRTLNTQKISSTGTLSLGGGILWVKGHDEEMTNVTVKDLNLNGMGGNQILLNPGSDAGIRMSFGGITRANTSGGTIRFHLLGDSEIATTATNTQNGILGSWATATVETGDYFAVVQDGQIRALNTSDFSGLNSQVNHQVGPWQSDANVVVEGNAIGSNNDLDINALRFTGSTDLVLADRLRIQSGGLLIDSATTATKISNGRISIGSNSNKFEFKIHQNAQQAFEISSSFERFDNSANGHLDITKSGSGELILSGRNYTGNRATVASNGTVRAVEGTLTLRGGNAISDNSTVNMDARTGSSLHLLRKSRW